MTEGNSASWSEACATGSAELRLGDWASFDVELTATDVDAFVGLSGDRSPIHVSSDYARLAGFSGRVAHGMLTAAFLSTIVGMFLPGRRAMLMSQKTDFVEPVPVGARVTVTGRVQHVSTATRTATLTVLVIYAGLVAVRSSVVTMIREGF